MTTLGQTRAKTQLQQLIHSQRVPHALLFLGHTGWGTLALALEFAQWLQCELPAYRTGRQTPASAEATAGESNSDLHQGSDAQAKLQTSCLPDRQANSKLQTCSCPACRKAAQFIHPDIHYAYPTIGPKAVSTVALREWRQALAENPWMDANTWLQRLGAENKQGNITREECQAIVKKLSLKAFEGRYKILLLWLPEYLGKEGNRLLKLIEEPPENTVFLLVAEDAEQILPTILSRCQLVKTHPLTDDEVAKALAERGVEAARAQQIAFLAGGDFNRAQKLAANPENDDARLLLDWLRKCWRGYGPDLVQWTENFAKLGRENQKQFLHYSLHFLRELLALVANRKTELRLGPEELQTAQNMAGVLNFEKIERLAAILNDNAYYIERNANPKTLFLDASIQINRILKEV